MTIRAELDNLFLLGRGQNNLRRLVGEVAPIRADVRDLGGRLGVAAQHTEPDARTEKDESGFCPGRPKSLCRHPVIP